MAKGQNSQGVVVLFDPAPTLEQLEAALADHGVLGRIPGGDGPDGWVFSGPALALPFRPEVNGKVLVDVVDRPWPDGMGDPEDGFMLFGAWSLGHFGPLTFPGNLERAAQHTWTCPEARELAARHT